MLEFGKNANNLEFSCLCDIDEEGQNGRTGKKIRFFSGRRWSH